MLPVKKDAEEQNECYPDGAHGNANSSDFYYIIGNSQESHIIDKQESLIVGSTQLAIVLKK